MKLFFATLALFFSFNLVTLKSQVDVGSLNAIYRLIDSAETQADMNYGSYQLYKFWESNVLNVEKKLKRSMSKKERADFVSLMKHWRSHVEEMSRLRSVMFKKDFMNPQYYTTEKFETKLDRTKRGTLIQPFIYNMSMAIYYEEKWIELDILLNTD